MFDPTAFDNMKVILEGAFYDLDLAGEIAIIDRADLVDLARLSREFSISFKIHSSMHIEAGLVLKAGLANLASELLKGYRKGSLAGSELTLHFRAVHMDEQPIYAEIQSLMISIWGTGRMISQSACWNPLERQDAIKNEISILFNRLITEEQLEELREIPGYMAETLRRLDSLLGSKK